MNYDPSRDRYLIPSLERAIEALGHLAEHKDGLSLAKLDQMCSAPKSTLFRILVTLQKNRWIVWDVEKKGYRLGVKLWELGFQFLQHQDEVNQATRHLEKLAQDCGESVFIGKLDDGEVIYLRMVEAPKSVTVVRKLGRRVPAHCTATGEAILAFLPPEEVDEIIGQHGMRAFNRNTVTELSELKKRLAQIRDTGYAVVDGEYNSDLLCVSSPVFNHHQRPTASVTVALLSAQAGNGQRIKEIGERVRETALNISRELGFVGGGEDGVAADGVKKELSVA